MTAQSKLHDAVSNATELSEKTRARYLRALDVFVGYAGTEPAGWNESRLAAFSYHLTNTRNHKPGSVRQMMASVRSALRLVKDPIGLTDIQVSKLLDTCSGSDPIDLRDRAIIMLLVEVGLKRAELLSLRIENVLAHPQLSTAARDALVPWLTWLMPFATTGPLFRPLMSNQPHSFGSALSAPGLQKMLDARGERAGIGHVDAQMLRRVHARRAR